MPAPIDSACETAPDIVRQLRLLADLVEPETVSEPDLRIFASAAEEIERLRSRIERISRLAEAAAAAAS